MGPWGYGAMGRRSIAAPLRSAPCAAAPAELRGNVSVCGCGAAPRGERSRSVRASLCCAPPLPSAPRQRLTRVWSERTAPTKQRCVRWVPLLSSSPPLSADNGTAPSPRGAVCTASPRFPSAAPRCALGVKLRGWGGRRHHVPSEPTAAGLRVCTSPSSPGPLRICRRPPLSHRAVGARGALRPWAVGCCRRTAAPRVGAAVLTAGGVAALGGDNAMARGGEAFNLRQLRPLSAAAKSVRGTPGFPFSGWGSRIVSVRTPPAQICTQTKERWS